MLTFNLVLNYSTSNQGLKSNNILPRTMSSRRTDVDTTSLPQMQPQSAEIKLHGASRTKPGLHANTKPDPKEAPGLQHRAWRVLVIELRVEPVSKRSTPHKTTLTRAALPSRLELRYNSRYVIETSTGSRAPRQLEHSIRSTVPLPRSQCRSLRDEEWTTIAKSTHATIGSSPSALRTGEATKVDVQGGPTLDRINTRCPPWYDAIHYTRIVKSHGVVSISSTD